MFFFIYSIFGLVANTKVYICLQINIFLEDFCCHFSYSFKHNCVKATSHRLEAKLVSKFSIYVSPLPGFGPNMTLAVVQDVKSNFDLTQTFIPT